MISMLTLLVFARVQKFY